MKVTLFSRWSNLSLKVTICKDVEADFVEVLGSPRDYAALSRILDDVEYYRLGLKPFYISKYTAKRIASFLDSDMRCHYGHINYFYRLEYANR